ncbi:MAG: metal-dependent hydrolase [Myxococcales bacterium]|nr:metal-dependent hydrolase [Myxococcales bacterium]
MASLGHIAVGMAAARSLHTPTNPGKLFGWMVAWSLLSMLPDADVIGFRFGVAYGDPWGHRGATHSLAFAGAVGLGIGALARLGSLPALRMGLLATAVVASHGLLDTLTDGGLGCALFWPFDPTRHFAPFRPIPVAPIGRHFISREGMRVALTELVLFAPVFAFALWPRHQTSGRAS